MSIACPLGRFARAGLDAPDLVFDFAAERIDQSAVLLRKPGQFRGFAHFGALAVRHTGGAVCISQDVLSQLAQGNAVGPCRERLDARRQFVGAVAQEGVGLVGLLHGADPNKPVEKSRRQVGLRERSQQRLAFLLFDKRLLPVSRARLRLDIEADVFDQRIGFLDQVRLNPAKLLGLGIHGSPRE